MGDHRPPDGGEPNEALQDMVSDPSMETADNDDDDHAFETSKNPRNRPYQFVESAFLSHSLLSLRSLLVLVQIMFTALFTLACL